ncbi:MAG: hypothetical protein JWR26_1396 [Pedosphaera sp.]|nr:hypothetical protein [Pedosphaera sp.]
MKTSRLLIVACLVAGIIALIWQARTIIGLRVEVAALRKDLRVSLEGALDNAASLPPEAGQAWREKLELIKLRNQVRELNESLSDSHARDSKSGLRAAIKVLLSTSPASGPWKIRPEYKGAEAFATNQYAQAMQSLAGNTNEFMRFLTLGRAAKLSLAVGRTEDARQFATDLLVLDNKYSRGVPEKSNGDAVHDGNLVLGRIAVDEGQIEEAKRRLLAAGKSSGSPVLGSFGPNMSLAKDLLAKGEQETVLQYLELCRKFWSSGGGKGGKLDEWTKDIYAGRMPDFGGNLIY